MTTAGPDDEATEFVFETGPTAEPVIRCTEVSRVYGRPADPGRGRSPGGERPVVRALDGVSLAVRPGEVVGISGPSGSGKSTLLHLISALDTPTDGTVEIAGTALGGLSERGRTRLRLAHVGIVFQRFYLLGALSARANVALPLVERGVGKASRRARATELLEAVGLGDRLLHRPGELSGGEQQRVAIARALVNDPDVLLADEPTGELDTATGERVIELLAGAADERAVVLASHDTRVLEAADRVVELRDGRRRDDG